jgi:ribosomal protein S18 acetylase RimI-like enzyme
MAGLGEHPMHGKPARAPKVQIMQARTREQIAQVRALFLEYAESLGFSLCFQGFDRELASLPGDYAPPGGRLLLAYLGNEPAGCVALHKCANLQGIAEMKRLYVKPATRGHRIGRDLIERVIADAKKLGYKRLRLDSVEPVMRTAVRLYREYGFREIDPYRENPMPGTLYMELVL